MPHPQLTKLDTSFIALVGTTDEQRHSLYLHLVSLGLCSYTVCVELSRYAL